MRWFVALLLSALSAQAIDSLAQNSQLADGEWRPTVSVPYFESGRGPVVLVDSAHGNFHTLEGRYAAFGELLSLDGYRVRDADGKVTDSLLEKADIYVISNAILGGHDAEWRLPTPSAFTDQEIDTIVRWVDGGGALWLIADHMPFPGATSDLALEFGVAFYNGFAFEPWASQGTLTFSRADGTLADHAITRGQNAFQAVDTVRAFSGQAFRVVGDAECLMHMPDDWVVLMPVQAWEFSAQTARVSARGLSQGCVMRRGSGRVAVFGEAAMFTAQTSVRNGVSSQMGMNHPSASHNARFVRNVALWLSGTLDH